MRLFAALLLLVPFGTVALDLPDVSLAGGEVRQQVAVTSWPWQEGGLLPLAGSDNELTLYPDNWQQGLGYQHLGRYGVARIRYLHDQQQSGISENQWLDMGYGYALPFARQQGLIGLYIGADYHLSGQADKARDSAEQRLAPYVDISGHWQLPGQFRWIYQLKYQWQPDTRGAADKEGVQIYTGVAYHF